MTKQIFGAALAALLVASFSGCGSWHCYEYHDGGNWGGNCYGSYGGGCESCGQSCGSSCDSGNCGGDTCGCDSCGCDSCNSCSPYDCGISHWWHDSWNWCTGWWHSPCGSSGCGCGELYWCDWYNCPPTRDPCNCCGGYVLDHDPHPCYQMGPRYGSIPLNHGGGGEMIDGEEYVGKKPTTVTKTRYAQKPEARIQ